MKILPTFVEVKEIAATGHYNVLPVSLEILSDFTTPIETMKILKNVSTHCYMLESAQANEMWGRYTFLGFDPKMEITCIDGEMKIGNLKVKADNPSDYLRQILADYKSPRFDYLPSFTGGLVGYFSYDYLTYGEPTVKCDVEDTEVFKDVDLMLFDKVIAFDHLRQKIILIVNMSLDEPETGYNKAAMELKQLAELLKHGEKKNEPGGKLLAEEKELAEHNMLVDLGRNDLGKISKFGTVQVEKLHSIERFSHVMHIGSTVRGEISENHDALDAIEAVLPAGTLSGAPKIRACQLIGALENNKRGIYGGAIGYIDFTGNMDTCIAIRIAYKKNGKVFVRSGAGIVADSVPENEFEECLNKAKASLKALELAQEAEL